MELRNTQSDVTNNSLEKPLEFDMPLFDDSERGEINNLPEIEPLDESTRPVDGNIYPDSERGSEIELPDNLELEDKWNPVEVEGDAKHPNELNSSEELDDGDTSNKTEDDSKEDVDNKKELDDGTRELTDEEKQYLKDKLQWPDERINKCTIDENGVIHLKTDRCDLEGKTSENGVPYERKTIEINGVKIEGVFPVFDSAFDTYLNPDNYKSKAYAKECNEKLKEAIQNDPELRNKFTPEQIKDIEEGRTPTGYVWHHNEEPGKMQLVKREDHDRTIGGAAHTGGSSLWGPDSVDNSNKGEDF